jgi:hypothetical protein
MKRALYVAGMLCVLGCGDNAASDKEPSSNAEKDASSENVTPDGGDGDGDGDKDAAAAAECVDDSKDTVTDPGFSCNITDSCSHFIGTGWTAAQVKADCDMNAARAMATACVNTGFCERKTAVACRVDEAADKAVFVFGLSDALCGFIGGALVQKPEGGWPATYESLLSSPSDADAGTDAGPVGDAATGDAGT